MKVAVLGGYGVFGARLCELLLRDGHDVLIVGRHFESARALAERIGGRPVAVDIRKAPDTIFKSSPDVVVDAVGPFHDYGSDPYVIPRLCLRHGADYLDLSDSADFTAGLSALDAQARESGRRLLSGASSVPGISSAVAADLVEGLDEILLVDSAIMPGNRAPRGTSVIASIVSQLGTASRVWRGGIWRAQPCWSDARRIRLAPTLVRRVQFIEVPDIRLFPAFFRVRSVMFRAGMELDTLNMAMSAVAALRRYWPFEVTARRANLFRWLANLFLPFGTDRGGMRVAVVGYKGKSVLRREWRLVAEAGDGPYIPAVTARAAIRKLDKVPPGARPCLAETSRREIEEAMSDLSVSTQTNETPSPTLFQSALADRWDLLPPEAQTLHSVQDMESFSGTAKVIRGSSLIARFAAWFFGFPKAADEVPLTITKTRTEKGEIWERNFGGRVFRSYCTPAPAPYRYRERFWLFNYEQELPVENGSMHLPVRRGWFLGIPLPGILLPASESREYARDGVFHFDVALGAPLRGGLIVRYRGWVKPDRGGSDPFSSS
ncbi:NAD(P)-dependent dehydrogenase (short-subunit alcohol dehydrogenase family) [Parvibaculum indicum]|uniref:SDR family oxidoreductase n=1 Tax=Parvibaculum indicum TaxID=562969 RepID=UPI00141EF3D5|nr:SDR family oxidoreductase [Parvibaculum indicum]NIJ40944.1 NAD(P)-dependent dehydrogenase (short-subunit alcohol dehydrogenase family) [Parvibaculum indicum]